VRQALTIRRTRASCGATGRLLQRFLDVSFQHHNQTLRNRDAKPMIGDKLLKSRKKTDILGGCRKPPPKLFRHSGSFEKPQPHLCREETAKMKLTAKHAKYANRNRFDVFAWFAYFAVHLETYFDRLGANCQTGLATLA
jgi:hypothetical protein